MTQVVVADLLTGRRIVDLPFARLRWERRRNAAGNISCTLNLFDSDVSALDIRNITTPGKTLIGVLENDVWMEAGPLWSRRYSKVNGTLDLRGSGALSYFGRRTIIPANGLTDPLVVDDEANPATNSSWSGYDLGTIMKKAVQQSLTLSGGALPILFEGDRSGTHEDEVLGATLKSVSSFVLDKSRVKNGPDFEFRPQWTPDGQGVQFLFRTGTEDEPRLRSNTVHVWDYTVWEPSIDDLVAEDTAEELATDAWASGGRQVGEALIEHARAQDLIDAGYPMFEDVDSSFATVSEDETLADHAAGNLDANRAARETMPFRVRVDGRVGQYSPGDDCRVLVEGDPFYPDGPYDRVIESMSGDEQGLWINIETSEVLSGA